MAKIIEPVVMDLYMGKKVFLVFILVLCCYRVQAQYSMGTTGQLNIPTADMQPDGTVMIGGNYMPQEMLPAGWEYDSGNYFANVTFFPWLELAYRCTLMKVRETGKWNQDRSVSVRLRPLKEGKWWPAVVIGSNDALTTNQLNTFKDPGGTRYFSSVFAVGTKHFRLGGHDLGITAGGHIPFRSRSTRKGAFGGIAYRPAFFPAFALMAEYDSDAVNLGASVRLFGHLSAHLFCYDFQNVCGGLRYEVELY